MFNLKEFYAFAISLGVKPGVGETQTDKVIDVALLGIPEISAKTGKPFWRITDDSGASVPLFMGSGLTIHQLTGKLSYVKYPPTTEKPESTVIMIVR